MKAHPYKAPAFKADAFNCPHCGAYAHQYWFDQVRMTNNRMNNYIDMNGWEVAQCSRCSGRSLWKDGEMYFPSTGSAPIPNPDLPQDVLQDYVEAREICGRSPRGAAALLRLGIQKLCIHLGEPGKNINADIKSLVEKGLPAPVQQALDVVRVVGNNAVHPGTIDLNDDAGLVAALFSLVNFIAEKMISEPKHIESLYSQLPQGALSGISARDGK